MTFNWKIGGEAGFGIMTSGLVFSKIATRSGFHIFDYAEYPSLIRGGHNTFEVVVSDEEVRSPRWDIDLLVCLNKDTFAFHKHRLHEKSIVMYDPEMFELPDTGFTTVAVPFNKIKKDEGIDQMMVNTIAVGASVGVLGGDISVFEHIIHQQFDRKGEEVVNFNVKLARIGYEHVTSNAGALRDILKKKGDFTDKMITTGNEAFSLGTMAADCRYYASYPMTPTSAVLGILATWQYTNQMVVRHPEDEISVITSALGASYAGARAAVATSGGGFALMVEALSFSGVAEIPIVVLLGMRSGPATGMPTWTEQGDLLFAVHAGHGEFPKIVLAPGDAEEMVEMTLKAFDLADIYQTPVIVLSDKFIAESSACMNREKITNMLNTYNPNRGKIVRDTKASPYLRYKLEEDGISEMLIPGKKGVFYQANSYEHLEDSHTTEEGDMRIKQVHKRSKKWELYLKDHFAMPETFGDVHAADVVFISWGGNKGPILDAQALLTETNTAYIHFTHLYPMPEQLIVSVFKEIEGKRIILIENNSQAQFGQLLRMQTGVTIEEKLLKFDGRPFWPEEIRDYVNGTVSRYRPQGTIPDTVTEQPDLRKKPDGVDTKPVTTDGEQDLMAKLAQQME